MDSFFTIVDSFQVKDKTVLAFDHRIDVIMIGSKYICIDGEKTPFYFTHNDYWLMIDGKHDFTGKKAVFLDADGKVRHETANY